MHVFLASILVLTAAEEVRVTTIDGPVAVGVLKDLDADQLVLKTQDGELAIRSNRILQVEFGGRAGSEPESGAPRIELRDGSRFPVIGLLVKDRLASFTIPAALDRREITVPVDRIAAVRFRPGSPEIDAVWNTLRAAPPAADLLVIRRENSVDHVEGILGDVDADRVVFELDGESIPVPRTKVDGLLYYQARARSLPTPLCTLSTPGGIRLVAERLDWIDTVLTVHTPSGLEITLPLADVEWLDYSAGKVVYVSDLEPQSSQAIPLIPLPPSAELLRAAEGPLFNRGFFSEKPMVRIRKESAGRAGWRIVAFDQGIGMRSRSELVYRLPEGFRRFQARVGIDAELGDRGAVQVIVRGDDRILLDRPLEGSDGSLPIDLEIDGLRTLTLIVDYSSDGDIGDRVYFCAPRILK